MKYLIVFTISSLCLLFTAASPSLLSKLNDQEKLILRSGMLSVQSDIILDISILNSSEVCDIVMIETKEGTIFNVIAAIATELLPEAAKGVCDATIGEPDACNVVYAVTSALVTINGTKIYKGISRGLTWVANRGLTRSKATVETQTYQKAKKVSEVFEFYKRTKCIDWESIYSDPATPAKGPIDCGSPSKLAKEEYSNKALRKAEYLSAYIAKIADKSSSLEDIGMSIELAKKLFADPNQNFVEVSSKNHKGIQQFSIMEYLNRVRSYQYSKVEITWVEIGYVSELRLAQNGDYYGVISIKQHFKGFNGDLKQYEDTTIKKIDVILKRDRVETTEGTHSCWDLYLGNIKVTQTW